MAERCAVCNGSGKHAPMGGILVMCQWCNGAGFLTDEKKILENREKRQVNVQMSSVTGSVNPPTVIPVNVPITPMVAQGSTISGEPVAVTTDEIEAIKSSMLAKAIENPAEADKRSRAYREWKAGKK
jgi:RecJ-like exonuclease